MNTMTAKERRGRFYTLAFIATLISFDLVLKLLLLMSGGLRPGQVAGTAISLVTCWFLWRGSKFARGFLVVCMVFAIGYGFAISSGVPGIAFVAINIVLVALLLALLASATSSFGAYQRNGAVLR